MKKQFSGYPDLEPNKDNIDPGIFPLVKALNDTGLCRTRASCEGHRTPLGPALPYVSFTGDIRLAEYIDQHLRELTHLPWNLDAGFGTDRKLWYRIYINREALYIPMLFHFRWWKKHKNKVDEDLNKLILIVEKASANINENDSINNNN